MGVLGRMKGWAARWGLAAVGSVVAVGAMIPLLKPLPAAADPDVTALAKVASSRVGLHQRLRAMRDLREIGSSQATAALAGLARNKDLQVASAACGQLGNLGTNASKDALKAVVEDSGITAEWRMSAVAALASHGDAEDLDYLEEKAEGDARLASFVAVLRAKRGE